MKYVATLFMLSTLSLSPLASSECFTSYQIMPGPVTGAWDLTVADFNHDGIDDVASVNGDEFDVYLSRGDRTFQHVIRYPTTYGAVGIAAGDFNNDRNVDLIVVANPDDDNNREGVELFLGNGDGTFRLGSRGGKQVRELSTVAVGDFDGDGNLDAVISPWFTRNLGVLLGNGDGTMRGPMAISPGSYSPVGVVVADFNGDGKLDVASISPAYKQSGRDPVLIYLGNGDGTFTFKTRVSSHGEQPFTAVAGDFNEDGKVDLAIPNPGNPLGKPGNIAILLGIGDGTFQPAVTYPVDRSWDIVAADLNGDGHTDLVTNTDGSLPAYLSILIGKGDGTFQEPITSFNLPAAWHLASGDFDRDGLTDLALATLSVVAVEFGTGQCP